MTLLTKDQILSSDDLAYEDVACPEWGGSVRIVALSGAERDSFETSLLSEKSGKTDKKHLKNFRARFISFCAVDGDGNRLFSEKDIVALGKKSALPISRCFDVAQRLSGMTDKDVKELEGES